MTPRALVAFGVRRVLRRLDRPLFCLLEAAEEARYIGQRDVAKTLVRKAAREWGIEAFDDVLPRAVERYSVEPLASLLDDEPFDEIPF